MKPINRYFVFGMFLCISIMIGILLYTGTFNSKDKEIYQISYIYRNSQLDESQQSIKQGISKASADYKFEIKEVNFDTSITVEEQIALVIKEVEAGANAILIEPLDDELVYDTLAEINKDVPVVLINAQVDENIYNEFICVNTNYYEMGRDLASYISQDTEIERVYLLQEKTKFKDKNEMSLGVYDELNANGKEVSILELDSEYTMENALDDFALGKYLTDAFVVFKGDDLELLGETKTKTNALKAIEVYGVEKSNVIITYLENDIIDCIGVPNEYSIGYQSAISAINKLNGEKVQNISVEYKIIDKNDIYTLENQRLLFPFMQ